MHWAEANVVGCVNFSNVLELNPFERGREREIARTGNVAMVAKIS